VPYHVLSDPHGVVVAAVMNEERNANEGGENGTGPSLSFNGDVALKGLAQVGKRDKVRALPRRAPRLEEDLCRSHTGR